MNDATRLASALESTYRIERPLGAGGMATVYLATDLKHDREVALKVLRPELGAVLGAERFLAEIKITARLDHPHILTLIDSGEAGGFLYYVLPVVRGESLRQKLNREKQLGVEEALHITKHVASALDYAHKHGVVHRDIKPENILLFEGEAMLTDFGIALAVQEAGGGRLTETGLSLGTPQYMSPEQATGDRQLDARSDTYSLGAVLYEMLAGEPPVTGPSAQAMIAKLMTERPVHLRVVRPSVPENIDVAVAKALDKTPADRFGSAGEFMRALELPPATTTTPMVSASPATKRRSWLMGGAALVAALAGIAAFMGRGHAKAKAPAATGYLLRDRTQLTTTGNVFGTAISGDGKQFAFINRDCSTNPCTYAVDVQDVGGAATHRILSGATAGYGLEWSPDRRNLVFDGTVSGRYGIYLLSALGGAPRFLSSKAAMFWAGGDSLIVAPNRPGADSTWDLKVTSIDGTVGGSIRIPALGDLDGISVSPGNRWIVALMIQSSRGLWQVFDRSGKVVDRVLNSCTCAGRITDNALWLSRLGSVDESIVRLGIDPATGKLSEVQDTLYSGAFSGFSVTSDGSTLVLSESGVEATLWALTLPQLLQNKFPADARRATASSDFNGVISPDGNRILLRRAAASGTGKVVPRYSIMPFGGGPEQVLETWGDARAAFWVDSTTVGAAVRDSTGMHVTLVDIRTGARLKEHHIADSLALLAPAGGKWVTMPASRDRLVVSGGDKDITIPLPGEMRGNGVWTDEATGRILVRGWNATTEDSLAFYLTDVTGTAPVKWAVFFAEGGRAGFMDGGALMIAQWDTPEAATLFRVTAPGVAERLGRVPVPVQDVSVSRDGKRAALVELKVRGDAYVSKVVAQR